MSSYEEDPEHFLINSMIYYTSYGYRYVNAYLRGEDFREEDEIQNAKSTIFAFDVLFSGEYVLRNSKGENILKFKRADDNLLLYRGQGRAEEIMKMPFFLSTSPSDDVAYGFAKSSVVDGKHIHCCIFELTLEEGMPYLDIQEFSTNPYEREIILNRNTTIELTHQKPVSQLKVKTAKVYVADV